jgi:hypothetical protein
VPKLLLFLIKAVFVIFSLINQPLNNTIFTFLVKFIEFRTGKHDIALSVHCNNLLCIFTHKKMFTKYYVVKNTSCAENIADSTGLCCHIFYIYYLRGYITGCSTSHKKIIWLVCYCSQTEIDNNRLLT